MKRTIKVSKAKVLVIFIMIIGCFGLCLKGYSSNSYANSTLFDSLRPPDTLFIDGGYLIRKMPRANQESVLWKTGDTLVHIYWKNNFPSFVSKTFDTVRIMQNFHPNGRPESLFIRHKERENSEDKELSFTLYYGRAGEGENEDDLWLMGEGIDYVFSGEYLSWYRNGKLKVKGKFKNNHWNGTWLFYDKEGHIYREAVYKDGKLESCKVCNPINSTFFVPILSTDEYE